MSGGRARAVGLLAGVLAALGGVLAGCGAKAAGGDRIPGRTLTIYASAPLHGPSSVVGQAIISGVRLALAEAHGRVGRYAIVVDALDDSTAKQGRWDPGETTLDAGLAAQNPRTAGYIGEADSGASAISIPVLNRAGIPQISAASAAVGLTSAGAGASPGEPAKYYPAGTRTFVRLVPDDAVQAAVQVRLQRGQRCNRTFVLDDGEVDGADATESFVLAARAAHLLVVGAQAFDPAATDYTSLAASVAQSGASCVLINARPESHAPLLTEQIAAAMPRARLFASAGLAEPAYVDPAHGGIPLSLDSRVLITAPPRPYSLYGYEAMRLMLSAIAHATDDGRRPAERSRVVAALFATRARPSVLGTYSIERDGEVSLRSYGIYRVLSGRLVLWRAAAG